MRLSEQFSPCLSFFYEKILSTEIRKSNQNQPTKQKQANKKQQRQQFFAQKNCWEGKNAYFVFFKKNSNCLDNLIYYTTVQHIPNGTGVPWVCWKRQKKCLKRKILRIKNCIQVTIFARIFIMTINKSLTAAELHNKRSLTAAYQLKIEIHWVLLNHATTFTKLHPPVVLTSPSTSNELISAFPMLSATFSTL